MVLCGVIISAVPNILFIEMILYLYPSKTNHSYKCHKLMLEELYPSLILQNVYCMNPVNRLKILSREKKKKEKKKGERSQLFGHIRILARVISEASV